MGNTISNCCEANCKETSSYNGNLVHPNGKQKGASTKRKPGKKKNVRFVGKKELTDVNKSSKRQPGQNAPGLSREMGSSTSNEDSAQGRNSEHAITSYSDPSLSFIEDVKDIKTLFNFDKWIGDGKFGTVFLAHPRSDPKSSVAIKLIPQKSFSHRIEKELHLLKSISHPNLIRYISAYKDRSFFYIVTEYCEGGELFKKIVDQNGLGELEAWAVVANLLSAVKFLHDRDIWHRDIKPENILFKRHNDEQIKLIDFGLSKQLTPGETMKKKVGTPYYLAPEVLEEDYGKEVDLWSIGVVTYVLLWGYPPFYGNGAKELFTNIYNVNYEFWEEDWAHISEEARDFIARLLIKCPNERMTLEEAMSHPWISSGYVNATMSFPGDDLRSNVSEIGIGNGARNRLDVIYENFSKSAEWTTLDSY